MSTRMLIDARHSEETRVAVVKGNKVEDFDYESSNKIQIKGNIYLAKITRVEPSLQAAFVEYGGNRHGFLAFSEIHPDYYQIPVEDRDALLAEEAAIQAKNSADMLDTAKKEDVKEDVKDGESSESEVAEGDVAEGKAIEGEVVAPDADPDEGAASDEGVDPDEDEDLNERLRLRQLNQLKRRYKIQEVIKPRQIMLIQVVKEERGNKGAALTTYISLAGRYTVLMPNTTHGGGISRKISNATDRKRLKSIVDSLDIPTGTGCIIRTAGMKRTKTEIKRDVEYIQKMWSKIRELTLKSVAPTMVYEEGNLIKRAIRDLYDRSIDEVQVEGEEGYKLAKDFMTLLMPSHAKRVQHYKDVLPIFQRYLVEEQLDGIFNPNVTLKSGGYIVINPTEALIAIDVNSGKSTKQHNIESTAYKTNLEAAVEIGRQLRLRDLAGLVVIDFIDMEERSHNRKVESKMKEAVKVDRARIMVNRISSLGLMEISRQRLRPNLEEASSETCPNCEGSGRIRNNENASLHVLRGIENEGFKGHHSNLMVSLNPDVAFYVLNKKRQDLISLEIKYGIKIELIGKASLISPNYEINSSGDAPTRVLPKQTPIKNDFADQKDENDNIVDNDAVKAEGNNNTNPNAEENEDGKPKRRRRRGGRGRGKYGRNRFQGDNNGESSEGTNGEAANANSEKTDGENSPVNKEASPDNAQGTTDENGEVKQPRRRGRRGGRRSRYSRGGGASGEQSENNASPNAKTSADNSVPVTADATADAADATTNSVEKTEPKKPARRRRAKPAAKDAVGAEASTSEASSAEVKPKAEKPKRKPRVKKDAASVEGAIAVSNVEEKPKKSPPRRKSATSKAKNATSKVKEDAAIKPASVEKPKAEVKGKVVEKPVVAVASIASESKAKSKADDKPKKRGWWQRNTAE